MKIKNKTILPFNWRSELDFMDVTSVDRDIILLEKPIITSTLQYPFKVDVTVAIICIKGKTEGIINLMPYTTDGTCLITILSGQIMQYKSISEDFEGLFLVMSQKFTDGLMPNAIDRLPLHLSVRNNPAVPLDAETLQGMIAYFEMLKRVIQVPDHPYRIEVARHLTLAFFYGIGAVFHKMDNKP